MKKGFYFKNTKEWVRCYYLTGEKKGNKWISIYEYYRVPNPEWWSLNWMCIPTKKELETYVYCETNPVSYKL